MSLGLNSIGQDLLKEFGTDIDLEVVTRTPDRAAGTTTESAPAVTSLVGLVENFRSSQVDGTSVLATDLMLHISPLDVGEEPPVPSVTRAVIDAQRYTVLGVEIHRDGNDHALYTLHLRAA